MGFEVKSCVNQLVLFTFEQALRRADRFYTVVRGGLFRLQSELQEKDTGGVTSAVFPVIILLSEQPGENPSDPFVQRIVKNHHLEQGLASLYRCQVVLTAEHLFVPFICSVFDLLSTI